MSASYSNVNYGAAVNAVNSVSMNAAITNAIAPLTSTVSNLVPKTTTVNGHALSGNVVISASDIGLDNVSNLSAINVPLTGYVSNTGALSSSDTILTAIEKLNGNIATAVGGGITSVAIANSNGFAGNSSGGNTPTITLTTSVNGLLKGNGSAISAAVAGVDYVTPNSAIANLSGSNTGDQTITLTGAVTGSGVGSFATTLNNASVTGQVLTGYASSTGAISSTDTILSAINKLSGNIATAVGGGITSVAIANSNGFAGNSSGGNTPTITLTTSVNGLLKGNGSAISAAVAGVDYVAVGGSISTATTVSGTAQPNITSLGTLTGLTVTSPIVGSVTGNARTVTNGIYTTTVNDAVLASTLTGYASSTGAISSTDTILSAINKLSGNITAVSIIANNSYNALGSMFNNQVGTTYTTTLNDSTFSNNPGEVLTFNNAATQTVTIPPNSSVACPIGATIQAVQLGVGKVTFIGGSGVTINSAGGLKSIATQYGAVTLMQTAIDVWVLIGTLIA